MENKIQDLILKALKDSEFKKRLLKNTKATIEKELNVQIPNDIEIQALEEKENTLYLIIPSLDSNTMTEQELSSLSAGGYKTIIGYCPTKHGCQTRRTKLC